MSQPERQPNLDGLTFSDKIFYRAFLQIGVLLNPWMLSSKDVTKMLELRAEERRGKVAAVERDRYYDRGDIAGDSTLRAKRSD